MKAVPLHRVAVVTPFTNFLMDVGAPFERAFHRAGLPVHALEDVNNFVPSQAFWKFLVDVSNSQDIPDLGFHVGLKYGANCADPHLTELLCRSLTLRHGLIRASHLINSTITHCQVGLIEVPLGQSSYLFHKPSCTATNPAIAQIGWFGIMTLIGMVRHFLGPDWRPSEIGVMLHNPPSVFIREQLTSPVVRLSQPYSYIALDNSQLSLPPLRSRQDAVERSDPLHAEVPAEFTPSIRKLLRAYVCEGNLTVDRIAETCNMSKRSLQRKLMMDGTSYSEILNELKYQAASDMLRQGDASITDVSRALGYANSTHFSRAFRRFAGISPRDYRRRILH